MEIYICDNNFITNFKNYSFMNLILQLDTSENISNWRNTRRIINNSLNPSCTIS